MNNNQYIYHYDCTLVSSVVIGVGSSMAITESWQLASREGGGGWCMGEECIPPTQNEEALAFSNIVNNQFYCHNIYIYINKQTHLIQLHQFNNVNIHVLFTAESIPTLHTCLLMHMHVPTIVKW